MNKQKKKLENTVPSCKDEKPLYCHLNLPQPYLYEQYLEHLRQDHNVPTVEGESGYVALNIRQGTDKDVQPHALAVFKAFSKEFLVMVLESQKEIRFYSVLLASPENDFFFTSAFYFFLPYGNSSEFDSGMVFKEGNETHQLDQKDFVQTDFFGPFKGGTDKVLSIQDSFYVMYETESLFSVEKHEVEQFAVCDGLYKLWIQIEKVPNPTQTIQPKCNKDPLQPKEDEEKLEWMRNEKGEYILEKKPNSPVPTKEVVAEYEELLKADEKTSKFKQPHGLFATQISSRFFSSFS